MLGKMKKGWRSLFSGGGGDDEGPDKDADKDAKAAAAADKDAKGPKSAKQPAPDKTASKAPASDKNARPSAPVAKAPAPAADSNTKTATAPSSDRNPKVTAPAPAPAAKGAGAAAPSKQPAQESDSGVTNLDSGLILLESPASPPATPRESPPSPVVEWATTPASSRPGSGEDRAAAAAEWDDILARARAALPPKESRKRQDG
jgi:hypothetical protein